MGRNEEASSPAERYVAIALVIANFYFALAALWMTVAMFVGTPRGYELHFLVGLGWLAFWALVQKTRGRRTFLGAYGGWILFAIVNLGWAYWFLDESGFSDDSGDGIFFGIIVLSIGLSVLGVLATWNRRRLTRG